MMVMSTSGNWICIRTIKTWAMPAVIIHEAGILSMETIETKAWDRKTRKLTGIHGAQCPQGDKNCRFVNGRKGG